MSGTGDPMSRAREPGTETPASGTDPLPPFLTGGAPTKDEEFRKRFWDAYQDELNELASHRARRLLRWSILLMVFSVTVAVGFVAATKLPFTSLAAGGQVGLGAQDTYSAGALVGAFLALGCLLAVLAVAMVGAYTGLLEAARLQYKRRW